MLYFLIFCIGIAILLFSTERLIMRATHIAHAYHLSALVIGATIVAIGTSLPELVVSVLSAIRGNTSLAYANIVGSNVINTLLILPVGLLIGNIRIGTSRTQSTVKYVIFATALFFGMHVFQIPLKIGGTILLLSTALVSFLEYKQIKFHATLTQFHKRHLQKHSATKAQIFFEMIFSIFAVICGGLMVVSSVEQISLYSGLSATVLGLTLTAIATSLPELFTTIYAAKHHEQKITIGNLLGSNMYNLLLTGGLVMLSTSEKYLVSGAWFWLMLSTGIFAYIIFRYKDAYPPKYSALFLLILFGIYMTTLK